MGARGPKPKPPALVVLEGNRGKRKINRAEPRPGVGRPRPPAFLSGVGLELWNRTVPELERMHLLTVVDGEALAAYCVAYGEFADSTEQIDRDGLTVTTSFGNVIQNPAVGIRHRAMQLMKAFAAEFGLTPSSRGRMVIGDHEEKSELERLLD